jgi:hypothetical protein
MAAPRLVQTADRPPYGCAIFAGCEGPFADFDAGYVSRTGLIALCEVFGFHPDDIDELKKTIAARDETIGALQGQLVEAQNEQLASADKIAELQGHIVSAKLGERAALEVLAEMKRDPATPATAKRTKAG